MANRHVDLMHKLINHYKQWGGAPEAPELTLLASEVDDLLQIFESLGICTKDGQDIPCA